MKPYLKAQTLPLEGLLDRRRRLTDAQKDEVRKLYSEGWSQRKLARAFGCSRTLVQLLVNPERAKAVAGRFKANWRKYANARGKAYAAAAVRSWRKYKYGLLKEGVLHDTDSHEAGQGARC